MCMVSSEFIKAYLTEKFADTGKISGSGREFIMESVFLENDWKRHMSINLDTGLWQDFKSGEKGNFIRLYAYVENLSYQQAQVKLLIKNFDTYKIDEELNLSSIKEIKNEDLGSLTVVTADSHQDFKSKEQQVAWSYLTKRCLFDLADSKKYFISLETLSLNMFKYLSLLVRTVSTLG